MEVKENPFELFFRDPVYREFKNHLYNYRRRRDEMAALLRGRGKGGRVRLLELGAGISPITGGGEGVLFSDLSEEAMRSLRAEGTRGHFMVTDVSQVALKSGSVSVVLCSEVMEHVADDEAAFREIHRVLEPSGDLLLTVPAHGYFFSYDDRAVGHLRRYDPRQLIERLAWLGFEGFLVRKVTATLEKVVMLPAVAFFRVFRWLFPRGHLFGRFSWLLRVFLPAYKWANAMLALLVKLEARMAPLALVTVILIACRKKAV